MDKKENERYIKLGITFALSAISVLLCYLALSRLQGLADILRSVRVILSPFLYGVVIAYLTTPLCRSLEQFFFSHLRGKRKKKTAAVLSVVASILFALIVLLTFVLLIIPQLVDTIIGLIGVLPGQIESAVTRLNAFLATEIEWPDWWVEFTDLFGLDFKVNDWLKSGLPSAAQSALTITAVGVTETLNVFKNLLIGLIIASYLLARRKQLAAQARLVLRGICPTHWADWIEREVRFSDRMFNGFFVGKLLDSLIIGGLCFVGCMFMRFDSPMLLATIVGITNIIPFFGPFIGAIPCALLLLLENPAHCAMFLVFILFLQQLDGNVIGPRILGNTTGMSGLWVMFAILLFGGIWGIAGMVIGVPLMAVAYDIIRQLTFLGVRKHGREELIEQYNDEFHPKP